ncbi:endonuclease Q family protein [Halobacillus salinus]|uniref:endonuclease Q family protein n=1 Tax=Halobacillus salinus TaxID=192814 RepID=UPI001F501A54|nr:endonuclease Q family protein [Halobacillus salinus]
MEASWTEVKSYFADLHIHVGRDREGRPVKITGARSLTLTNIVKEASRTKGLDLVGVIDAQSPAVIKEIKSLLASGEAMEQDDGGIVYENTLLVLGSEIEIYDALCKGPIHVLCYFPYLKDMEKFSDWLSKKMKNVSLSTQRFYGTGLELQEYVNQNKGLFVPAHIFTPFKSMYGKGVKRSLEEVFDPRMIDAVELGLSADTAMADKILELERYTYLTNSDAHSLGNLAREYQKVRMEKPSFLELSKVMREEQGRGVLANYGLDPRMGKYHKTVCAYCLQAVSLGEATCPYCHSKKIVKGVYDRIEELKSASKENRARPAYIHQVLLSSIPGIGKKTYQRLIDRFGSEMNVVHQASTVELEAFMPAKSLEILNRMRAGRLSVKAGGGGKYGSIDI